MASSRDFPASSADPVVRPQDPTHDPFDTPLFNRLLGLIEKQNITIEEHGAKLDALVKDAQKGTFFCSWLIFMNLPLHKTINRTTKQRIP